MALPRPCVRCGTVIPAGSRCAACDRDRKRITPGRGSGATQRAFRRDALAKTGGKCYLCGSDVDVDAHHVIGLEEGGSNDGTSNGLPLCKRCHAAAEARNRGGAAAG